ncbi:hypothetical protein [Dongia sp.]|uniref:hypothetical protein n=1 Tax=Dongia sp. TaxID=1977262 RepID=UPI0035B01F9E
MRPSLIAAVTAIGAMVGIPAVGLAEDPLYIAAFAITRNPVAVQSPDPLPGEVSPVAARVPIGLWTKLAGNQAGLDRLRKGRFELFHLWTQDCGILGDTSSTTVEGEKKLAVNGRKAWQLIAADLQPEVDDTGYFDWRTVSEREFLVSCRYTIKIVDERGAPLPCPGHSAGCEVTFDASDVQP